MRFTVTVITGPPATLALDPLRREGASSLLGTAIARLVESSDLGPWWSGSWWMTDDGDAVPAVLTIEADSAEIATTHARAVVDAALADQPLLHGWRIVTCDAVEADQDTVTDDADVVA